MAGKINLGAIYLCYSLHRIGFNGKPNRKTRTKARGRRSYRWRFGRHEGIVCAEKQSNHGEVQVNDLSTSDQEYGWQKLVVPQIASQ